MPRPKNTDQKPTDPKATEKPDNNQPATPPPNRRRTRGPNKPPVQRAIAAAERRDAAFGKPCALWEIVAWFTTEPGAPLGQLVKINAEWSLWLNPTAQPVPIEPDGNPQGLKCGPGEAIAFRTVPQWGTVPTLQIRRNSVWSLTSDAGAMAARLEDAIRAAASARKSKPQTASSPA